MFNNFSILSELIMEDRLLASKFLDKLSKVYRYVIQNFNRDTIPIGGELAFLNAYFYLMEIRYEGALIITITPELSKAQGEIPPLTLQLLVENALKHNSFSEERPLMMSFSVEEDYIVVSNTLQPIARQVISTGIGQRNIMAHYALLSARKPIVEQTDEVYTASITALTTSLSLSMAKSLPQLSEKPESGTGLLPTIAFSFCSNRCSAASSVTASGSSYPIGMVTNRSLYAM